MKKSLSCLLIAACMGAFAAGAAKDAQVKNVAVIPLKNIPTRTVLPLAPADCPEGKIAVLKVEMFYQSNRSGGWNPMVQLMVNKQLLDDQTADGSARLLGSPNFKFKEKDQEVSAVYFNSKVKGWTTFYSVGDGTIDPRVLNAQAFKCTYLFDVSDILTDAKSDKNTLTVCCNLKLGHTRNKQFPLTIRSCSIIAMSEDEVAKLRGE